MYHAIALIITAIVLSNKRTNPVQISLAGWCFLAGIVCFSGSLYLMTFLPVNLGYITPIGGILFIIGWLLLALAGPGGRASR
jgi:uncharacterized membrane protein YgdD (TMEM256/DUF423 family)